MKSKKHQHHPVLRETLALVKFNFLPMIIFEVLYYFFGTVILLPLLKNGFASLLNGLGLAYVAGNNLKHIFLNPIVLLSLLGILIILAFYVLFELSALILCFNESRCKHRVQIIPLISNAAIYSFKLIHPRNWLLIFILVILTPFLHVGITSNFLTDLSVPGFIMTYIQESAPLNTLYVGLSGLLILLAIRFFFAIHLFILTPNGFLTCCKKSNQLLKKRFFKTIWAYIKWELMIFFFAIIAVIFNLLLTVLPLNFLALYIYQMQTYSLLFIISLSVLAVFVTLFSLIYNIISTPLSIAFISNCYYQYTSEAADASPVTPMVTDRFAHTFSKKQLSAVLIVIFIFSIAVKAVNITAIFDADNLDNLLHGPSITGHRGNATEAPENTAAALEAAIARNADYVEIDIAETKDGVLVVSHDNNLKRISGEDLNIYDSTYDQLKDLDIGSHFSPEFSDQRIMTLDEAITICKGRVKMNIELKPTRYDTDFPEKTIATVKKYQMVNDSVLASLDYSTLERIEKIDSHIRTAYISAIAYGQIAILPVDVFSLEATFVTPEIVQGIHAQNKDIYVWTVDSEDLISKMVDLGVDNIITDNIALADTMIKENPPDRKEVFTNLFFSAFYGS